jgi:hypothetical protein
MGRQVHKDVEFHVDRRDDTFITRRFDEAAGMAIAIAASTGTTVNIDVVVWSRAGARAYQGDSGVEIYDEDPEASVFERIEVKADSLGRVP